MNLSLEKTLNQKIEAIFNKLGLDTSFATVKNSDRPDLSDFQCNGALGLARSEKKNPREIAQLIVNELQNEEIIEKVSIDGPGFINISIKNELIAELMDKIALDERKGVEKVATPKNIVLDYGGPNVAKEMHVGHLRPAIIGESIKRIVRYMGNNTIGDVHLGDWGTPMGMIISEIIFTDGNLDNALSYNIEEVSNFYKKANLHCKEDESARDNARKITVELQNGDALYRKVWKHLRDVSVDAITKNYDELDISFDLWLGESDAHEASGEVVKISKEKNVSVIDDGALIIRLKEENKPKPPVILVKSDGGFGYPVTDIATIKMRVDDLQANEIIYVADQRQALHFEQVFEASNILGICPDVDLTHIGFGTINGKDGKPFKTRDGGVMNLETLITMSKDKVRESTPTANEVEGYDEAYIENLVRQIAVAAIKFQDLKNTYTSGYVFELEDFAKFEGKTGPYIQYAIARINSILRKAAENNIKEGNVIISNPEERALCLKISNLNNAIFRAYTDKEPSIISDFAYTLAQSFSSFYNVSSIMNAEDSKLASSRLKLATMARDILITLLDLLGISSPEIMLKK